MTYGHRFVEIWNPIVRHWRRGWSIADVRLACFSIVLGLTAVGNLLASHPYHVSYAEVEWNAKSGNFEVALCVWPEDLEKALAKQTQSVVDLDKLENLDTLAQDYLEKRFLILKESDLSEPSKVDAEKPTTIRWVGHELALKKVWLYFEIKGDTAESDWNIQNLAFKEINEDQENHIQLTLGDQKSFLIASQKPIEFQTRKDPN
ncbi:MAG: DUF6702 family protein [Planctomycetota bacterium]